MEYCGGLIEAAVTDEDRDVTLQVRKVVSQTEITHSSVVDEASENSETRVVTGTRLRWRSASP